MKTKTWYSMTALCASVVALTALPSAADPAGSAAKPDESYTGTVNSVDPNGRTLEVKGFLLSKKFNLGDQCALVLWNKPAGAIGDLRAGEKVKVAYQDANGVLVADRIQQEPMTEAGMIKAIDPMAHTLTLRDGMRDKTLQLPANCQVTLLGDRTGSPADLQPGYCVTVTYELPQDQPVARAIAQTEAIFTGKLTAVDMDNRTMKAKSLFDSRRFNLADNCAILINGKTGGQLSDLKLGEPLTFSYQDVNGIHVVSSIANQPASPPAQMTSVKQPAPAPSYMVP
jgi:hypothetical protein